MQDGQARAAASSDNRRHSENDARNGRSYFTLRIPWKRRLAERQK